MIGDRTKSAINLRSKSSHINNLDNPMAAKRKPKKAPNVVTRAELARVKQVSRAAVTQACRPGGPLYPATVDKGVDIDHPSTVAWLTEAPRGESGGASGSSEPSRAEMLRAQLRKRQADAGMLEARLEILRSRLVPREAVRAHLFGYLESLQKRLLTDMSRTAGMKCETAGKTGGGRIAMEQIIRDEISSALQSSKRVAANKLRNVQPTANPPPVGEPPEDDSVRHDAALVRATGAAVAEQLEAAAANVVDRLFRSAARLSCGERYHEETFQASLAAFDVERETAARQVRIMLGAAVDRALSVALRPQEPTQ